MVFRASITFSVLCFACTGGLNAGDRLPQIPSLPRLETADDYVERGLSLLTQQLFRRAADDFTGALDIEPQSAAALIGRANAYRHLQKYSLATQDLERAATMGLPSSELLRAQSLLSLALKKPEEALGDANRAVEYSPNDGESYRTRAIVYRRLKRSTEESSDIEKSIQLEPTSADAYAARAEMHRERKEFALALTDNNQAVVLAKVDPLSLANHLQLENRARTHIAAKDFESALKDLHDATENNPNSPYLWNRIAWIHNDRGDKTKKDFENGIEYAQKSLNLDPYFFDAYDELSYAYEKLGDLKLAIKTDTKAIELDSNAANRYRKRGMMLKKDKQYAAAIADYTKAAELEPNDAQNYNYRGLVHVLRDDRVAAIADYTKAIELDPKLAYIRNRALSFKKLKEYDNATRDYTKLIELEPQQPENFNERGMLHDLRDDHIAAIADYTKAIGFNPRSAIYVRNRAESLKVLKRYDEAIADYAKAIELDPTSASNCIDRGLVNVLRKDYEAAVADYTKAIELDPTSATYRRYRAIALEKLARYDAALIDYDKAIEIQPGNARNYNYRGMLNDLRNDTAAAIADYTKAIALDLKSSVYLRNRADTYEKLARWGDAIADYSLVIQLEPNEVENYAKRGGAQLKNGNIKAAIVDIEKVLELTPKSAPDFAVVKEIYDKLKQTTTVSNAPSSKQPEQLTIEQQSQIDESKNLEEQLVKLRDKGEYEAALKIGKQVVGIRENILGPDHPGTAAVLYNLARVHVLQRNYVEAEPLYQRVLKIFETTAGPNHPATASTLNSLAGIYKSQANYAAAEPLYQRALKISETALGLNHPDTASNLGGLAQLYQLQGNLTAAEPLYKRNLQIREKAFGPDHPETAASLNNLAELYVAQGNYAAAEPLHQQALKISEKALGPYHPDTANSLSNLALLYCFQGKYAAAEPLCQRALNICEKTFGPDHPNTSVCVNNLGGIYRSLGNDAAAEPLFRRGLKVTEKAFGPDHPDTARGLNNLAGLFAANGDSAAAEPLYQRAIKILEKAVGPDHPETSLNLNHLATVFERLDRSGACELFDRARSGTFRHVSRVLGGLTEAEQQKFIKEKFEGNFRVALSSALIHRDDVKRTAISLAWIANGKGIAQDALAARNLMLRDVNDPKLKPVIDELQSVQNQLAVVAMTAAESGKESQRQKRLDELTTNESRLSKELALATGSNRTVQEWVGIEELRNAVPSKSVLIDIARFDVYDFKAAKGKEWKPAHYAAWITPPSGQSEPKLVDLGLANEIDALVQSIRLEIKADGMNDGKIRKLGESEALDALNSQLKKLSDRVWKPISEHLADAESIILSPDGALWLAPWVAFPINAENDPLIKKYSLRLLIRGRDLVAKRGSSKATTHPVIFADPKFDSAANEKRMAIEAVLKKLPNADDGTLRSFSAKGMLPKVSQLPNTATEAKLIEPNIAKIALNKPTLYQERYALESIAKVLKRPKLAIFATHGFFLPSQETKKEDRLADLANNQTRSIPLDTSGKPIENPLLRCGLLFAGCNNGGAAIGDDDGILTGMEIIRIDFRGTDMVILSACETGVGDVKNGEGVAGLRQAFQLAGAKVVVASLWQVPDRDSAVIMNDFFENVAKGQTASEAMRQAQLKRIESRTTRYGAAHPLFWAAWTVTE